MVFPVSNLFLEQGCYQKIFQGEATTSTRIVSKVRQPENLHKNLNLSHLRIFL
jgi:hypothetical protein